jgi:hypothetical protein
MVGGWDPRDFLESFSELLKGTDKSAVADIYDENAQVSIDSRVLGHSGIVDFLRLQLCEFTLESYTYLPLPDGATVVTGICLWGNHRSYFTFVLRGDRAGSAQSVRILHQMVVRSPVSAPSE